MTINAEISIYYDMMCKSGTLHPESCDILCVMCVMERKIKKYRLQLEALYLKCRAGEACPSEVLAKSVELDHLLLAHLSARKAAPRGAGQATMGGQSAVQEAYDEA